MSKGTGITYQTLHERFRQSARETAFMVLIHGSTLMVLIRGILENKDIVKTKLFSPLTTIALVYKRLIVRTYQRTTLIRNFFSCFTTMLTSVAIERKTGRW